MCSSFRTCVPAINLRPMIELRSCDETHYQFAHDLVRANMEPYIIRYFGPWDTKSFRRLFDSGSNYLIAKGDRNVGYVRLRHIDKDTLKIDDLQVIDELQGQGVGTLALQKIYSIARESHYHRVELRVFHNNPAKRLYEREGFDQISSDNQASIMSRPV